MGNLSSTSESDLCRSAPGGNGRARTRSQAFSRSALCSTMGPAPSHACTCPASTTCSLRLPLLDPCHQLCLESCRFGATAGSGGLLVAEGPGVCLSPHPSFLSINTIAIIPKCYRCRNWDSDRLHGSPSKVSQEHSCFQSGMICLLIHSFFQSTKGNLLYTIHWSCSGELNGPRPPEAS